MAQRGIAVFYPQGAFQEADRIRLTFDYRGWQHADEGFSGEVDITPSILSGAAIKGAVKDVIAEWYGNNTSENYDAWNGLLDGFTLIGGSL